MLMTQPIYRRGKGPQYPSDSVRGPQGPYGRFVEEKNLASVRSQTVTLRTSSPYVGYYLSPFVINSIN
jgi:hypothetical protein